MTVDPNYDFSGYATKYGLKCTDGRTIKPGAFKHQDGTKVPLVWQHGHNDPDNVLGYAILEHRDDGTYAYGYLNKTESDKNSHELLVHGDIESLSIFANELVEKAADVLHGTIREVSLVLAGANPGARIDYVAIAHSDGSTTDLDDSAVIIHHDPIVVKDLVHASDDNSKPDDAKSEKTVEEVINSMTEEQQQVVFALFGQVAEKNEVEHSDSEGDSSTMKSNVFDKSTTTEKGKGPALTHDAFKAIVADAQKRGSFRDAMLAHAVTYGIENIDYLFPDARMVNDQPVWVKRDTEWVPRVLNAARHTPFSRIKTMYADLTADTARALGYPTKGALKKEEFFKLMKRVTTPTTIYKKQKLDRDDVIDITDLDVVAWMKGEMRMMLDEEIARAMMVGDGRAVDSEDKINEENIRPIWKDDDLYSHKVQFAKTDAIEDIEEKIIRARENYKGSGSPVLYTTTSFLNDLLLQKDTTGRRLYNSKSDVANALLVSDIVEVPVMANLTRTTGTAGVDLKTWALKGIIVNLRDYSLGADRGGEVSMFEDFDIDYNQMKYLLETRCSGALTLPKAALVLEQDATAAG